MHHLIAGMQACIALACKYNNANCWYDRCVAVHENPLFPQFCQYKEYNAGPFYKHILLELMVLLAT